MLNDYGTLTVRAVTGGAYPVKNALVRVIGGEEDNRFVTYTMLTDEDGLTKTLNLPAPATVYSMAPAPSEAPYSLYNLEIDADGYYSKRIYGVTVFPGVNSLQEINMIPLSNSSNNGYPDGNLNAIIPENEDLN